MLKGYCVKLKLCPKVNKKSFLDVLVTVNQKAIRQEKLQLFYENLKKNVNQLLGDPNCEAPQWIRVNYCQKHCTTSKLYMSGGF